MIPDCDWAGQAGHLPCRLVSEGGDASHLRGARRERRRGRDTRADRWSSRARPTIRLCSTPGIHDEQARVYAGARTEGGHPRAPGRGAVVDGRPRRRGAAGGRSPARRRPSRTYVDRVARNPYTGGEMQAGEGPGEYTYKRDDDGRGYRFIGHLEDGEFTVPWTPDIVGHDHDLATEDDRLSAGKPTENSPAWWSSSSGGVRQSPLTSPLPLVEEGDTLRPTVDASAQAGVAAVSALALDDQGTGRGQGARRRVGRRPLRRHTGLRARARHRGAVRGGAEDLGRRERLRRCSHRPSGGDRHLGGGPRLAGAAGEGGQAGRRHRRPAPNGQPAMAQLRQRHAAPAREGSGRIRLHRRRPRVHAQGDVADRRGNGELAEPPRRAP